MIGDFDRLSPMIRNVMYRVPRQSIETELTAKKSRFIARAGPAMKRVDAMNFLGRARDDYTDASHHCWAYLLGPPDQPLGAAMSDDGEPSGTAGRPIQNVLQHKNVGDIVVVVIRYFGGIKLGAGGLVRAYSSAAQQVMEQLPTVNFVQRTCWRLRMDYSHFQDLRHWLTQHDGSLLECEYTEQVLCNVEFPLQTREALLEAARQHGWTVESVEAH
jgi:uncharacterized YigZ family protein